MAEIRLQRLRLPKRCTDLAGHTFGRLTAKEYVGRDRQKLSLWKCECECGDTHITRASSLRSGAVRSCGCLQRDIRKITSTKHGLSVNPEGNKPNLYQTWSNMKSRCFNSSTPKFRNHGGRGITVCMEWIHSYENFHVWATNNGYESGLTLERKDNNGDYSPSNCIWTSYKIQNNNKRDNHTITYHGVTRTISGWSEVLGIKSNTLHSRLTVYGWNIAKALTLPVRRRVLKCA